MSATISITEFTNAISNQANAFASAWSAAGEKFLERVIAEGGQAVLTAERQAELLAQSFADEFRSLSSSSSRWAAAAAAEGNPGIATIMSRYAEQYAAKANVLLDPVLSAEARIGVLAAEARTGALLAESTFGGSLGRALGPAYDAYQMTHGALQWASTGNSASFGQAAMGVALSWGVGIVVGGLLATIGASAITVAVVAGIGAGVGSLMGANVFDEFNDWADNQTTYWNGLYGDIARLNRSINTLFSFSTTAPIADPLTLDLDGDGIETAGINASNPIMFDISGTGILQSVGWVGADDGFLVRDLNGNGLIDSGAELFGDATALAAGQTASDGFAALADLDANQDGVVNASDAAFAQLRVWRDLDQNGVTDAGELQMLSSLGIAGLNVASTSHSQTLTNGNEIADLGTFIKADGQVGALGQTADVNLAVDTFTSQFTDTLPVNEAANEIYWELTA